MKTFITAFALALFVVAAAAAPVAAEEPLAQVPYPKGYRDWVHVKSMVIKDERHPLFSAFGGFHHIYANPLAVKALKSGKPFDDGATIVFDLLDSVKKDGSIQEGPRLFLAMMERNAKLYAKTEGWVCQVFTGADSEKREVKPIAAATARPTCHKEVGAKGFTFCDLRD